jgi:chitinase
MNIHKLSVLVLVALVTTSYTMAQDREVIGYYPSWKWSSRNNLVSPDRIPYDKLTIINYAFWYPRPDGRIAGKDTVGDGLYLRGKPGTRITDLAHAHGVRVVLSFGGWEDSENFPAVASTPVSRARFAHSCVEAIRMYDFDGIDIDWEYPGYADHKGTPEDRENCTEMFKAIRDSLNTHGAATGKTFLLTAAVPAGGRNLDGFDLEKVAALLDMLNVMTYDFYGPWDAASNHNSPLYASEGADESRCIDAAFKLYTRRYGIPASKINLGVPFYGQTYTHCTSLNARHAGPDTTHFSRFGAFYYDIVRQIDKFTRYWDDRAQVPYLVSREWDLLVSYDDELSVRAKAQYALASGARGLIIWEITGDFLPDGRTPLLNTIHAVFHPLKNTVH